MSSELFSTVENLLHLSSALETKNDDSFAEGALTLKQLIGVHESLLNSVLQTPQNKESIQYTGDGESKPNSDGSIEMIVNGLVEDEKDADICVSLLSSEKDDSKILLVVQYLLRLSKPRSSPEDPFLFLDGLKNVTFPLLLNSPQYDGLLRDAIMDASFSSIDSQTAHENNPIVLEQLESFLELVSLSTIEMLNSPTNVDRKEAENTSLSRINAIVNISSRIYERLLNICNQDNSQRDLVLKYIHNLIMSILNSLCFYSDKSKRLKVNGKTNMLMRPITAVLLPAILENGGLDNEGHAQRIDELWCFICFLVDPVPASTNHTADVDSVHDSKRKCRSWEKTASSVSSALLCVMASEIHSTQLILPTGRESTQNARVTIIQHPTFWNFIQTSLTTGNEIIPGTKGGVGFHGHSKSIFNPYQHNREGVEGNLMEIDYESDADVDQMVRRRAIHVLSIVIDKMSQEMKGMKSGSVSEKDRGNIDVWKKYIMCFEALEMEAEVHLVEQVWSTVLELCDACVNRDNNGNCDTSNTLPNISWDWVGALFARVLMSHSPTLRKLGLFRLFMGEAGIKVENPNGNQNEVGADGSQENVSQRDAGSPKTKKKKAKSKKNGRNGKAIPKPAPINTMSPGFLLNCLIPSYDSLASSVGTGVNFEVNGKVRNNDLAKMLPFFLTQYTEALLNEKSNEELQVFMEGLLSEKFMLSIKIRSLVLIFKSVLEAWKGDQSIKITLSKECLKKGVVAFHKAFHNGAVVFDFRQSLLLAFSKILSLSVLASNEKPDPELILDTLALYPASEELTEPSKAEVEMTTALNLWVCSFGEGWAAHAGAACASSFISGDLVPFHEGNEKGLVVTTYLERQRGASIAKLCALSGASGDHSPSALLWPSINKGLQFSAPLGQDNFPFSQQFSQKVARSIILLQYGCQERVLSGVGHGDLVLDKDGNMLPLPPTIELVLSRSINFTLDQLRRVSICNYEANSSASKSNSGGRSTKSGEFSRHFNLLIKQLIVLQKSYPSSVTIVGALNKLLRSSVDSVTSANEVMQKGEHSLENSIDLLKNMSIIYGTLTIGAEVGKKDSEAEEEKEHSSNIVEICCSFLDMKFGNMSSESNDEAMWQVKAMRSIFELAKWGCLYFLVPMAYDLSLLSAPASREFHDHILKVALDSVNACPENALPILFDTAVSSIKQHLNMLTMDEKLKSNAYAKNIARIIETLFSVMNDTRKNSTRAHMLNVTCSLIFSPQLVSDEFNYLQHIKNKGGKVNMRVNAPIFQAFRKLIEQAGSSKPHISKYAMSYISVGWLGNQQDSAKIGSAAIPYRQDIAKLLIHKEEKLDKSNSHQEGLVKTFNEGDAATLPDGVPHSSMARAFLMVFISKLPNPDKMGSDVLTKFCHYLIMWLLDNVCLVNERTGKVLLTTGSVEYVQKIRAWQSLCMLHRFVTPDIAPEVMKKVFEALNPHLHGPIRYFVEVFTIQISRSNPLVFVELFRKEIKRCDITQQHVSSLMIIGGNLFVGEYSDLFIKSITENNAIILRDVIAGSVPWLSSTQGFSRAIAQLLVHKLIPLAKGHIIQDNDSFFLDTIFKFLETNNEMKRLRNKQSSFFNSYDVDTVCTPEGMFGFCIDSGEESNPPHLVEVVKKCLVDISTEREGSDTPEWKQLEDEMEPFMQENDDSLVNFQRKILPVDTLNLTLEDQKKTQARNAAGRKRQSLIVCASLIDKVTNLAGLTRTAEIFAAEKIIVPDATVRKMDNFKSIAVGAEDWIDVEECKEANLLQWLKARKKEGYSIIGIEQTNSSSCLSHVQFDQKSVLLLGKEKEGIPVQFLQFVDKCVEIPQLGIIRSLNVHVSGAISVWEYTKQMMMRSK